MSEADSVNYTDGGIYIDAQGYRFRTIFDEIDGWILTKVQPELSMVPTGVISVVEQKLHMSIEEDFLDDDPIISGYIAAAESYVTCLVGENVADMTPVPGALRQAIKMLAAHYYENREATAFDGRANEMPFGLLALVTPYRTWGF